MKKQLVMLLCFAILLAVVPFAVGAKDEASGKKIKIKNAKIVDLNQRYITVARKGAVYVLDLALADPGKLELISKYGIQVDLDEVRPGDRITFKGRDFGGGNVVPGHMYLEKGSHAYTKKKGKIAASFYGDVSEDVIALAHSHTNEVLYANKKGAIITYKKKRRRSLNTYWGLLLKGKWSKTDGMYKDIKYIKIRNKHKNAKPYSFGAM